MKKVSVVAVILLCVQAVVFAFDFMPAIDAETAFVYPYTSVDKELKKQISGNASASGSFMMNTDYLPQLWFVPSVSLDYAGTAQPLNIADSRFLFLQGLDSYVSAGLNYEFNDKWQVKGRYFYRKNISKQTKDEVFGKGLYDYSDNGFYMENVNALGDSDLETELTFGFKYIDRKFPNYKTLLSDPQVEALQGGIKDPNSYTKEKDGLTYSVYLSDETYLGDSGWSVYAEYAYDYMPYMEQRVIDSDGSLTTEKRTDRESRITLEIPYVSADKSGIEFDYSLYINMTNQNYYDQMGTSDVLDDKFISNYFNYYEHTLGIKIKYEFPGLIIKDAATKFSVNFDIDLVNYSTRFAKDSEGKYKTNLQRDNNYTLGMNFTQNFTDWWFVYFTPSFTKYASNMDWEAYGLYNYTYFTVSLGTGVTF